MICYCCGSKEFIHQSVLWKELIDEWRISSHEVAYINKQQGTSCKKCGSNLRSIMLAGGIMKYFRYKGLFQDFVKDHKNQKLKVLEINEAGNLTKFLSFLPNHVMVAYPDVDMMNMTFADNYFDLIVHSDVLEHILHPIRALSECKRVLKEDGLCAFTVPIIVERLTTYREGMPPSYHGSKEAGEDFKVYTEYGCDVWKHVIQAGFQECRIFSTNYPVAQALIAVK